MKKVLFALLALVLVFALAACGQDAAPAEDEAAATPEEVVTQALDQYLKAAFPDMVEEVAPTEIKVYTADEIAANEALQTYELNEGDVVFEATYDMKIAEGVEDLNQFTAATGEIDGQWIRNKSNLGIVKDNGDGTYTIDAFGTGW
ncbi:MAG: hypothetical protein IJH56_00800 [Firmicutes bacterium]|nr:hypothetical protein [Bacillota bacterium]MBR0179175.1 hypothetical protein [Bacillota bacterium]